MSKSNLRPIVYVAAMLAVAAPALAATAPGAAPAGASAAAGASASAAAPGAGRGPAAPGSDGITGFGACSNPQPAPAAAPAGAAAAAGRGGGGGGNAAAPAQIRSTALLCLENRSQAGFTDLFNGRDLTGWEGEAGRWTVRDGILTGETTAERPLPSNNFLIWTGGTVRDFDMKFEWRLSADGNSGIQYRSERLPSVGPYVVRGGQYDMGERGAENYTANIFEERGPTFLANRGAFSWQGPDNRRETIGFVGGGGASGPGGWAPTRNLIKTGDWNRGEIIARGDTIIHLVNDQVVAIAIDQYPNRIREGLVAIQLHMGPPMKIEFKSIKLKQLPTM